MNQSEHEALSFSLRKRIDVLEKMVEHLCRTHDEFLPKPINEVDVDEAVGNIKDSLKKTITPNISIITVYVGGYGGLPEWVVKVVDEDRNLLLDRLVCHSESAAGGQAIILAQKWKTSWSEDNYERIIAGKPLASDLCSNCGKHTRDGGSLCLDKVWCQRPLCRQALESAKIEFTEMMEAAAIKRSTPHVDVNAVTLVDGSPVTPDHRELKPNGQQKGYVVLSEEERAKGFVRPVRNTYRHSKCGTTTTMGQALSETYARDPSFYGATFCCKCERHLPVSEFTWDADGTVVGS